MKGEYKVPGGKLIVVEANERDGLLVDVAISGDFFLEPDDALEAMTRAIEGLPITSDAGEIARRVRDALPDDVVMLGVHPEAVATAVRRAIAHARSFGEYDWEYLAPEPLSAAEHMALDQVLTEEVGAGRRGPTLRIWEWNEKAVIIGSFQSLRNEVDSDEAAARGVSVFRRVSGGGAMFIEPGNTITYSIYAPAELVQGMSFADSYAFLDDWVLQALHSIGIAAEYKPLNDIASPQGKIGGAAQKRLGNGAVLHHVTMAYDIDADAMMQVLRIGREKLSDKGVTSAGKRVDPIKSQSGMSRAAVIDTMVATFRELYGLTDGAITEAERSRTAELVTEKFLTDEWLRRVP
jgi:lipoate-protein ligase A